MSFKKTSLMLQFVVCFFVFLMTVSAGSAMAASKIVFQCSDGNFQSEICIMNPDGSGLQRSNLQIGADRPSWSPDGSQIVFNCTEGICVMDADFGNAHLVASATDLNLQLGIQVGELDSTEWSPELPANVASISPFGQFVIVFLLGGASALWMTKRRQAASPLTTT